MVRVREQVQDLRLRVRVQALLLARHYPVLRRPEKCNKPRSVLYRVRLTWPVTLGQDFSGERGVRQQPPGALIDSPSCIIHRRVAVGFRRLPPHLTSLLL